MGKLNPGINDLIGKRVQIELNLRRSDVPASLGDGYPRIVFLEAVDRPMIKVRSVHAAAHQPSVWLNLSAVDTLQEA